MSGNLGSMGLPLNFDWAGADDLLGQNYSSHMRSLNMATPGMLGAGGGAFTKADPSAFGPNIPTAQLALGGLGTIGNLFMAHQAQGLARKQFGLTRDVANTNLTNQIKSYNTALGDRIAARAHTQGMRPDEVDSYLARNSLSR